MTNTKVKDCLYFYVKMIVEFENCLKSTYHLEGVPYHDLGKIPKNGVIQLNKFDCNYRFHGSGCTFNVGSIEVGYDFYINLENYIITSPWKFMRFIESYSDEKVSEAEVVNKLASLNSQGIVTKVYEEYLVYEVSFSWFYSFNIKEHKTNS